MAKTSQHGCMWWLVIGWWWRPIVWLIKRFEKKLDAYIEDDDEITFHNADGSVMTLKQTREILEEHERQRVKYEAEQEELKKTYSKMGVAVSLVSERAIASDALEIANELCKARVRRDAVPERVILDWRPLTKGGKVPKCVLKTTTVWDRSNGDSVTVHAGYLADIEPYTAEVHIWTDGSLDSYKIRVVEGRMQVVSEEGE